MSLLDLLELVRTGLLRIAWLFGIGLLFFVLRLVLSRTGIAGPAQAGQRQWRPGMVADVLHYAVNGILISPLLAMFMVGFSAVAVGVHDTSSVWVGAAPVWVQFVGALLVADFVTYWRHRLEHSRWFWRFHAVHHSSRELDWLSNFRIHPVDGFINSFARVIVLYMAGFSIPIVALSGILHVLYVTWSHVDLDIRYGPLDYILVSPVFHRWHHAADAEAYDKNFAGVFSIFDLVFGTFYLPEDRKPVQTGLIGEEVGHGYLQQLVYPLHAGAGSEAAAARSPTSENA